MSKNNIDSSEKDADLTKYRDLVLATLDYYIENSEMKLKTANFDSTIYYESLKIQVIESFEKGRLTELKRWFHDLTEISIESNDLKFNKYLQNKTKYRLDIFESFFKRIDNLLLSYKKK